MTEFRPGSFHILPTVIKNLLIINALVFLAQLMLDGLAYGSELIPKNGSLSNLFALHHLLSTLFKPWQMVTYLFMHGSLSHLVSNMFALWMFGSVLENLWGPKRFLVFYFVCGLGAAVLHLAALWYESMPLLADFESFKLHANPSTFLAFFQKYPLYQQFADADGVVELFDKWKAVPGNTAYQSQAVLLISSYTNFSISGSTIGASGAVFGCLAAFGYLFPNHTIYLYFFVPIKVKWMVAIYMIVELVATWRNSAGDNVAHIAHLGGALVGFLLVYFWTQNNKRHYY